jgi:F0F1-type ATP synthase membrane subunit a
MELPVSDYSTMPTTLTLKGVLLRLSCFSAGASSNIISTYSLASVIFSQFYGIKSSVVNGYISDFDTDIS